MSERWSTCLMDPPWPEHGGGKIKRGADRHYPLVPVANMYEVIQLSGVWRPADDAHLYMWVTNNYLPAGLRLMADLGFRYVTNLCWVKDRAGLGQYFRGQHEPLLFGVRGEGYAVRTEARDITTVIDEPSLYGAPRGEHSAKPSLFRELIEARSHGPYLEMFARSGRAGWEAWGTQAPGRRSA